MVNQKDLSLRLGEIKIRTYQAVQSPHIWSSACYGSINWG